MQQQKLCLKWNNHTVNLLSVLGSFQQQDILVDVTLSCEGRNIKAHKMVLSACSPYFQSIFLENPCQHPIVIINGMKFEDITAILNFMYKGEVNVSHDGLSSFLQAAEALKVKGLAEVCGEKKSTNVDSRDIEQDEPMRPQRTDTPNKKRHRNRKRSLSDSNRSDDEATARKHNSPEIHELSGDESFTGDMSSNGPPLNSLPRVPQNVFSRSHQSSSNLAEEGDDEYEVEPSKLLEQTLTTENVQMSNSGSSDQSLRIERIMSNATEMESSSMQEPESPPDIKPIIEYGDSNAGSSEGMGRIFNDQSQPGPSNFQESSHLHDNSQAPVKILPKPPSAPQIKLKNILFPVTLPTMPQLFLINSNVWAQQQQQQQQQQQEQQHDIEIVPEQRPIDTSRIKVEKVESEEYLETCITPDVSSYAVINNDTPLPEFSECIKRHLENDDVQSVWGSFIDECARHYYERFPNIQNSSEYQTIGRKMFANYPIIQYEGKEPWSFFCKCLSQKIRHIKWKVKRKKMGQGPPRKSRQSVNSFSRFRPIRRKIDHRYTASKLYKALLKELSEGWKQNSITEYRISEILKQTSKGRRTWLESHPRRKMSSLLTEYPCFMDAKYIVEDFLYTINHEDTSLMLERFESLFNAAGTLMTPSLKGQNFPEQYEILRFLEEEISFEKGRRSFSKSIVVHKTDIPDDEIVKHLDSAEDSFPELYIFSNGENIKKSYVVGDKAIIETNTTGFFDSLIILLAVYYACGIDYPKPFSQILGLLQLYVIGESFDGIKSNKFKTFVKSLSKYLDIDDSQ